MGEAKELPPMLDLEHAGPQLSDNSRRLLTITILLSAFSAAMAAVIMNIGLPAIIEALGARQATAHWLITGFTASGTLSMLLAPWSARRFGIRRTFLLALMIFVLASMACAASMSLQLLIVSRIVQGMASGLITTLAIVALSEAYPVSQRGRAMATFGMGVVLAPMLGPALGGVLMAAWGWRSLMVVPLPFCLIALWLGVNVLPVHSTQGIAKRFDGWGLALLTATLVLLLGGVTQLQLSGWPTGWSLAWGISVLLSCAGLVLHELRCPYPLVDLRHFRVRSFAAAGCVAFVYGLGVWGSAYILPLYLQIVAGYSPLQAGLILLPGGVLMMLMIPIAGRMADARAPHGVVTAGLICFAGALMLLAVTQGVGGLAGTLLLTLLISLGRGVGLGIMIPALDATASRVLTLEAMAEGLALMSFLRQLGGALSPSFLALVLEARITLHADMGLSVSTAIATGYQDTLLVLGALFIGAALPAWRMRIIQ